MPDTLNDHSLRIIAAVGVGLLYVSVFYRFVRDGIRVKMLPNDDLEKDEVRIATLVPCETINAISIHARQLAPREKPNFSGRHGVKKTLCNRDVGWDNRFTLKEVTCSVCLKEIARMQNASEAK